jgi:hypothetical protein
MNVHSASAGLADGLRSPHVTRMVPVWRRSNACEVRLFLSPGFELRVRHFHVGTAVESFRAYVNDIALQKPFNSFAEACDAAIESARRLCTKALADLERVGAPPALVAQAPESWGQVVRTTRHTEAWCKRMAARPERPLPVTRRADGVMLLAEPAWHAWCEREKQVGVTVKGTAAR